MTVITIDKKDVLCDGDWDIEREVTVERDENKSFGISIVGGTVNVSENSVVSGIFIKNIITNSPADKTGLLKVGDRILVVDGTDIRNSSHEHAMKTIKNADNKMVLLVQSLVKKIVDCNETTMISKKKPPPITPCKTPELELIHEGKECSVDGVPDVVDSQNNKITSDYSLFSNETSPALPTNISIVKDEASQSQPATESDNSSDDEDNRDLEGKTYTKAGIEIDRASAGNMKQTKEEIVLDTEEEDCFGYTAKKIKKRYGSLGTVICHTLERSCGNSLGISLAGHRDRTKMACFIAGINPKGIASAAPFEIGDEILEVNGIVLHGRSHLNVPAIIKCIAGSSLKFILLRTKTAPENLAVKPVTQFPVCIEEEEDLFASYKNVRIVSVRKGPSGLGIMIIEGKHAEVGQGIFISDIQEDSMADKAGLNIGEMILAVNRDSLIGCSYETAASLLKKAEGLVMLKICNPNKTKDAAISDINSNNIETRVHTPTCGTPLQTVVTETNHAKGASRPVTPKPHTTPAKEVVDPLKAAVVTNEITSIDINTDKKPLGILVVGGCDSRVTGGAVIVDIFPKSIACTDKRLQILDQILEVNGVKITADLTERQIQKAVKQLQPKIRLVVFRPSTDETEKIEIELVKKPGKQLGLGFRANHPKGVVITDIVSGGIAEADGKIQKGDIVMNLNSESISNTSYEDCSTLFKTVQGRVTLTILRPKPKKRTM